MSVVRGFLYEHTKLCQNCTAKDKEQSIMVSNPLRFVINNCTDFSNTKVIVEIQNFNHQGIGIIKDLI
jgi:hypothetical protein